MPVEIRIARGAGAKGNLHEARESAEREHILKALEESKWNVSGAARVLGMERTNLHKRIRALGLSGKSEQGEIKLRLLDLRDQQVRGNGIRSTCHWGHGERNRITQRIPNSEQGIDAGRGHKIHSHNLARASCTSHGRIG